VGQVVDLYQIGIVDCFAGPDGSKSQKLSRASQLKMIIGRRPTSYNILLNSYAYSATFGDKYGTCFHTIQPL